MWKYKPKEDQLLSKLSGKQEMLIDIPIIRSTKMEVEDQPQSNIEDLIEVSLNSSYQCIQRKQSKQIISMMTTVKTKDIQIQNKRIGIDFIILVDVSSSMLGAKIELAQSTLSFIVGELAPQDRLSIIKFSDESQIVTPLMPMTPENKLKSKQVIYSRLCCCGSTNIIKGLKDAYDVITSRKEQNVATSIFFLSDGEDTNGNTFQNFKDFLNTQEKNCQQKTMDYSINCFGYGRDHDEKLLSMMASFKQGNFYYIKDLKKIDDCFIDCFGKLLSTFAVNSEINLFLNGGVKFVKKYGYHWDSEKMLGKGKINLKTIASGFETNYLAELEVPSLDNNEEFLKIAVAILSFDSDGKGCSISKELKLQIVDSPNLGPVNNRVEEEMVRVKLADLVLKVEENIEKKDFTKVNNMINDFKGQLGCNLNLKPVYKEQMLGIVSDDLMDAKYTKQAYHALSNFQAAPQYACFGAQTNCLQRSMKTRK